MSWGILEWWLFSDLMGALLDRTTRKAEPGTTSDEAERSEKPSAEGDKSLTHLVGETGWATTPLRPAGKAWLGDLLVDVTSEGSFVEPESLVEVIDVQGHRVVVKQVGA